MDMETNIKTRRVLLVIAQDNDTGTVGVVESVVGADEELTARSLWDIQMSDEFASRKDVASLEDVLDERRRTGPRELYVLKNDEWYRLDVQHLEDVS